MLRLCRGTRLWTSAFCLSLAYPCVRIHGMLRGQSQDRFPVAEGWEDSFVALQTGKNNGPPLSPSHAAGRLGDDSLHEGDQQETLNKTYVDQRDAAPGREERESLGKKFPTVCLALIAKTRAATELLARVKHLSMQHSSTIFSLRYLVVDDAALFIAAESLVHEKYLEEWFAVNHSDAYEQSVNFTAAWDSSLRLEGERVGRGSLDDGLAVKELDHYFAIDQCNADYVAILESDMIVSTQKGYSWISEGIQALQDNEDLILVMPAFPGMSERKVKFHPTTRPILKSRKGKFVGSVGLVDTTCEHPFSLPGHASLLDLRRYKQLQLASFGQILEHRCGGALVHGKPCKKMAYVRKCGGTRSWASALECVICNSPAFRQAHLAEEKRGWLWYAPMTVMRHDMGGLRAEISKAELQH
ncbi:unnamed protein product [Symbiodinium sp. CCMP2592]|nr:unnamed protein product [Symbiodinium sp. CCMP2592]